MLQSIVDRLSSLLTEGRIEYADLKGIIDDLPHLTEAELDSVIGRLAAMHQLLVLWKQQRPTSASQPPSTPRQRKRSRKGGQS